MQESQIVSPSINFTDLSEYLRPFLQQIGMNSSVAEAHGLLTGILCVEQINSSTTNDNERKPSDFHWFNLLDLSIDEKNVLAVEARNEVDNFYQMIISSLDSEELDFQLGIDDNDSLMDRVNDFSIWTQSFLYGLGLNEKALLTTGSKEINGFIKDLVEISRAEDYSLSGTEDDEKSLFELTEYVRMGVLLVYQEFSHKPSTSDNSSLENLDSAQEYDEDNSFEDEIESNFDREAPLGSSLFH